MVLRTSIYILWQGVTDSLRARRLTELLAHQTGLSYYTSNADVCYGSPYSSRFVPVRLYLFFINLLFSFFPQTHTPPFFFFLNVIPLNALNGGGGQKDFLILVYYRQFRLACGNGMQIHSTHSDRAHLSFFFSSSFQL